MSDEVHGLFRQDQINQLLKPINPNRVLHRQQAGMTLSYITAADARAHMNRIFGFGNWDSRTLNVQVLFTNEGVSSRGKSQWEVGAIATVEVSIRNPDGEHVCTYSESAVASSNQPSKGEALDMAVKSSTSDALKRCLIALGDQFGLGLYLDGSLEPIVKGTLVAGGEEDDSRSVAAAE